MLRPMPASRGPVDLTSSANGAVTSIEPSGREWVVVHDGSVVSMHPTRTEAERAAGWLVQRAAGLLEPPRVLEEQTQE